VSKRIIVAAVRSECSNQAANWLAQSGLLPDSQVLVIHVVDNKAEESDSSAVAGSTAAMLQVACPSAKIEILLKYGPVGKCLIDGALDWQSDLIVLGPDHHSGLERLLLGSVNQFVTERAHCPVMIARHEESVKKKNNVLIAVDDSEYSAAALEWVSEQPWARSKNFVILSVMHALPASFNAGASTAQASEMLLRQECEESLLSRLVGEWSDMLAQNLGKDLVPFAISEGEPVQMILQAANQWPIEMIVVGSHVHSGLTEMLLGNVSQAIAAQAPCTVTVVRGLTSTRFDTARTTIVDSSELTKVMAEKPHPARISGSIVGNNLTAGMSAMFQG